MSWEEKGKKFAVRVPTWKVEQPLPVDLCFETEILDVKTGKTYRRKPLFTRRARPAYGYLCPNEVQAFAKDRTGLCGRSGAAYTVAAHALSDPGITRYYPGSIASGRLRMKIVQLIPRIKRATMQA